MKEGKNGLLRSFKQLLFIRFNSPAWYNPQKPRHAIHLFFLNGSFLNQSELHSDSFSFSPEDCFTSDYFTLLLNVNLYF